MQEIILSAYNSQWPKLFAQEAETLKGIFKDLAIAIHHKGSTSVPNLMAKPIIDITIEVEDIAQVCKLNQFLAAIGYDALGEYGMPLRRFFIKTNPQSYNLHVWDKGHAEIAKDLLFRDALIQNSEVRATHENLKKKLRDQFQFDREQYIFGKDRLIKEILRIAGYDGLSMVHVLLDAEKQAYQNFMKEEPIPNKSLVVSQGVTFIGAFSLDENDNVKQKNIISSHEQVEKLIDRWLQTKSSQ